MNAKLRRNLIEAAFAFGLLTSGARARELDLAKTPLFLGTSVKPNIIMSMDDSGSMRAGFMPEGQEGPYSVGGVQRCEFQLPRYFASTSNTVYYNPAVTYLPPLQENGTRLPNVDFHKAWVDGFAAALAKSKSPEGPAVDLKFVDLATDYFPTYEMFRTRAGNPPTASEPNYTVHPSGLEPDDRRIKHTTDPIKLSRAAIGDMNNNGIVDVPPPAVHPDEGKTRCNKPTPTAPSNPDGGDLWATLPFANSSGTQSAAFYYTQSGTTWTAHTIPPEQQQNFANWYSYYRTRMLLARSAMSETFAGVGGNLRLGWSTLHNEPITATTKISDFVGATRKSFFSWLYTFKDKDETFLRKSTISAGQLYMRSGLNDLNPYYDAATHQELACRSNNHLLVTDGYWNEENPNPIGVTDHVSTSFPDGPFSLAVGDLESKIYWNEQQPPPLPVPPQPVPATHNCKAPTTSGWGSTGGKLPCAPTLADIAFHYWATDLRPDLPNIVPRRWKDLGTGITSALPPPASTALAITNKEVFFNPANDPANWQHMVNYFVSMGVSGTITVNDANYLALRKGTKIWPAPRNQSSTAVDDTWHATINSRGQYRAANNVEQLKQQLEQILRTIEEEQGTASAATVSSGVATGSSFAIRTEYDTGDWSGNVRAYPVNMTGFGENPLWDAAALLKARSPDSRVILTADDDGEGTAFRWDSLSTGWQAALNDDPDTLTVIDDDGLGEARLEFLRGVRTHEGSGGFRSRLSVLGSVIHSGAAMIGAPSAGYNREQFPAYSPEVEDWDETDGGYLEFVETHRERRRVAYVGSNDGMLHAFDAGVGESAGTGAELWAYVPRELAKAVGRLTSDTFGFEPMVDSTPVVRDVFIDG